MSYLLLDTLSGQELCLYPGILHSYILLGSLNVCVCVCTCVLSSVWLFTTPWTVAFQAPLSMGLPSQVSMCICMCVCVCVCVCARVLSCVRLFATPWTVASQAPLSMGLPRQEYWSGLLFPTLRDRTWVSCISCIGRQILYHCSTRGSSGINSVLSIYSRVLREYVLHIAEWQQLLSLLLLSHVQLFATPWL